MKKTLAVLLALVMVFSCASAMAELIFTTGGTSGTYYAFGNVLAQYITNNTELPVTAVAGNGSAANIDLLDLGDAQLGFVQNDVANYAYNGIRFEQYRNKVICKFLTRTLSYAYGIREGDAAEKGIGKKNGLWSMCVNVFGEMSITKPFICFA